MIALTREVPPSINECELTHIRRDWIDVSVAREEHLRYERALEELGCTIRRVSPAPDHPDSTFIEDTSVVIPEVAIVTRPGALSRRDETGEVARVLREWRPLVLMQAPATMDGGDVLRIGRRFYVGLSGRTNEAGLRQFRDVVIPLGYEVRAVRIRKCLHLKSAVTEVADETLLINSEWIERDQFNDLELIEIDSREDFAANALRVGGTVLFPSRFPATRARLESSGLAVRTIDGAEMAKAEGGLTCGSILIED